MWLVRRSALPAILVDTGDLNEKYTPFLESALRGSLALTNDSQKPAVRIMIQHIVLTHWHHDHVGGLPLVLRLLDKLRTEQPDLQMIPRVHKFLDPATDPSLFERLDRVPMHCFEPNGEQQSPSSILWPLTDGEEISVADPDDPKLRSTVRALYTPGHANDHACLLLVEDHILLTGDNVLGRGSTVFENLIEYLRSIQRCAAIMRDELPTLLPVYGTQPALVQGENVLYPGHGPVITRGKDTLRRYVTHRMEREEQILALLYCDPNDEKNVTRATAFSSELLDDIAANPLRMRASHSWSLRQLIEVLYTSYPVRMYPALARGLLLHLQKLAQDARSVPSPLFAIDEPLPTTKYAQSDAMVRCLRMPSYQRTPGNVPDAPLNESAWWEMLDLPWQLTVP